MNSIGIWPPTVISSGLLAIITVLAVLNVRYWTVIVPIAIAVGLLGLILSGKEPTVRKAVIAKRWRVTVISFFVSIAVYAGFSMVTIVRSEASFLAPGLILLSFVMFPFYYGAAQVLAILLVPAERK